MQCEIESVNGKLPSEQNNLPQNLHYLSKIKPAHNKTFLTTCIRFTFVNVKIHQRKYLFLRLHEPPLN